MIFFGDKKKHSVMVWSSVKKSWFQVIQDDIKNRVDNNIKLAESIENTIYPEQVDCDSLEQKYYCII